MAKVYTIIAAIVLIAGPLLRLISKHLNRHHWQTISEGHYATQEREWELMKKRYGHPYPKRTNIVMDHMGKSERVDIYKEEHKS